MNLVWVVSILIICIPGSTEGASRPAAVNVGAMCTVGTINGRVSKIAIEAAVNDVNSDPTILGGTKLSITFHDSNFSGFLGIIGGNYYYFYIFCMPAVLTNWAVSSTLYL